MTEKSLKRLRGMLEYREQRVVEMEDSATRYHISKELEALQEALALLEAQADA